MAFVEGTSRDDLKKGPGHYPGTPLPGTIGNAAIAGHRTTYLHPFCGVDKMEPGDGHHRRDARGNVRLPDVPSSSSCSPTDVWVVDNTPDAELTLTRLQPEGFGRAAHRDQGEARASPRARSPRSAETGHARHAASRARRSRAALDEGLSGQTKSLGPTIFCGIIVALVGARVVVGVPALAAPVHVGRRRPAVPDRAVPVLRVPGTRACRPGIDAVRRRPRPTSRRRRRASRPFVHRTPVLRLALTRRVGRRRSVFVKAEHLQRIGAFKYRGATNAVQSLSDDDARRGVAAHSSGNHAAALALAAARRAGSRRTS